AYKFEVIPTNTVDHFDYSKILSCQNLYFTDNPMLARMLRVSDCIQFPENVELERCRIIYDFFQKEGHSAITNLAEAYQYMDNRAAYEDLSSLYNLNAENPDVR
ncbi:MAG: hypothetical protein ACPGEF_03605, partial [Endozoicomonas sp.]